MSVGFTWAECIRKQRKMKESQCSRFLKDPFKVARDLLKDKKSSPLAMEKEDLEEHIKKQFTSTSSQHLLGSPCHVPQPAFPTTPFEVVLPRLSEVVEIVRNARLSYAPGPNGILYKL